MFILKDMKCGDCNGNLVINQYPDGKGIIVDGATCEDCFKEVILPGDEYYSFCREHGVRVPMLRNREENT